MSSLSVIVCLILFGWFAASAIISFGISKGWNEEQIFNAHMYIGSLVNVSISMQYPVYMFFSKEYRLAFREQLQFLGCGWSKVLRVDDTSAKVEDTTQAYSYATQTNN